MDDIKQTQTDRKRKRRNYGLRIVESLHRLPDDARVPLAAIEVALALSTPTVWRRIRDRRLPPLQKDGRQRYYTAETLRKVLMGSER